MCGGFAANIYDRPLSPAEQADKDMLDNFATSIGFTAAEYRVEGVAQARGGGGQR